MESLLPAHRLLVATRTQPRFLPGLKTGVSSREYHEWLKTATIAAFWLITVWAILFGFSLKVGRAKGKVYCHFEINTWEHLTPEPEETGD